MNEAFHEFRYILSSILRRKSSTEETIEEMTAFRYIAVSHLFAAELFSKLCGEIEIAGVDSDAGQRDWNKTRDHASFAMGSIVSTVAFLEGTINELFSTAAESQFGVGLDDETTKCLAAVWKIEQIRRRSSILDKYQLALELAGKELFNKGSKPYQNAKLVIEVRNALVHYVPDPISDGSPNGDDSVEALEQKLSKKFPLNPFRITMRVGIRGPGGPPNWTKNKPVFFPDSCIGHGCAQWAVNTARTFADEFCSRLGWSPPYHDNDPVSRNSNVL